MDKKKGVSSKTHTQKQLDDYANQNNPNNKAYQARMSNMNSSGKRAKSIAKNKAKKNAKRESEYGVLYPLDWMCYSNPCDME